MKLQLSLLCVIFMILSKPASSSMNSPFFKGLQIALGLDYTCLLKDGAISCWGGNNADGRLGNGQTSGNELEPSAINYAQNTEMQFVSEGIVGSCFIRNSALFCWGNNQNGRVGNNSTTHAPSPVLVSGMATGVTKVATIGGHTCAIRNGILYCWGLNSFGQLGTGDTTQRLTPQIVQPGGGFANNNVQDVAVGNQHTCAMRSAKIYCWGENAGGQLGVGTIDVSPHPFPIHVTALAVGATHLVATSQNTCAIVNGASFCWGRGITGTNGNGSFADSSSPSGVQNPLSMGTEKIVAGQYFFCALKGGNVYCWGTNTRGQLGDGTTSNKSTPVLVQGLPDKAIDIDAGVNHACAISKGDLYCWGANGVGQLGTGQTSSDQTTAQKSSFLKK